MNINLAKPKKSFAWSWSRLKNYRICPRRYYHTDLIKDIVQPPSAALVEGDFIHNMFQKRVTNNTPLPDAYNNLKDWGDELVKEYTQHVLSLYNSITEFSKSPSDWLQQRINHKP